MSSSSPPPQLNTGDPKNISYATMSSSDDTVKSKGSVHVTRRTKKSPHYSTRHDYDMSYDHSKLNIKVPQFSSDDPELWFALLESQFNIYNVTDDSAKFSCVTNNLDILHAKAVKDIIINPPAVNKYEKIKSELVRRLSASRELKVKQLLTHEVLGDRKPSEFLRHLLDLAGPKPPEEFIRSIWTNRLPSNVQSILASQPSHSLEQLADLADKIQEITLPGNVASTSSVPAVSASSSASSEIAELKKMVQNLTLKLEEHSRTANCRAYQSRPKHRRNPDQRPRSRSNSSYRRRPLCWYHAKFNDRAKYCIQPCDFGSAGNAKGSR
ncbi:uncharacterized protein LOC121735034 [Aricia agestis]|uniref:uncharacterized protein LOC121735034 n=1 Tax=Aricia agestis TaxID=91739 RepID=UPI001C209426|nr:uncharacterized protein LOC121735034 [Aricia agestis]